MSKDNYNGWTNYATWRVNLEWVDGLDVSDWGQDLYETAQGIKDHVTDCIECQYDMVSDTRAIDYALAFLSEVNWREIASNKISEYASETEQCD